MIFDIKKYLSLASVGNYFANVFNKTITILMSKVDSNPMVNISRLFNVYRGRIPGKVESPFSGSLLNHN